jgi:hypothetical protein
MRKELHSAVDRICDALEGRLRPQSLHPNQPICVKCVRNLLFYDGWHCFCEEKEVDEKCWVNFNNSPERNYKAENKVLRKIIAEVATNIGGFVSEEASLEFIQHVPEEVKLVMNRISKSRS